MDVSGGETGSTGLAQELRNRLAEIEDENEAQAAVVRRSLEDLEAFADYALPLIESLDALPKSATWGEWLDHLGALATRALRQPQRVLSVLSELSPMAAVGPVTLNDVLNVISDLLLQVGVPPPAQRYGGVFVGPVEAARGMSFDAVFVPGLAERLFPAQDCRRSDYTRCSASRIERRPRNKRATPRARTARTRYRSRRRRATPLSVLSPFGSSARTAAGPLILCFGDGTRGGGTAPQLCRA